jgi:hypothetical protein
MVYPRSDRRYAIIVGASTRKESEEGGMGSILAQIDQHRKFHVIIYASTQLIKHEKTILHFCWRWML